MYVLQEYLISLAVVFLLGLVLFGVAVVVLVAQSAVSRVAATTVRSLPKIFAHVAPPRHVAVLKKGHEGPLVQS